MEETDGRKERLCSERETERGRDKRDADIKLVARQIKREGKKWSREGQEKKNTLEAAGEGDTATMIIKGFGTQFTTSKIFAGALLFTDTRAFDESFLSDCAMPRNAHSYCSEQSNTKPPTDAPLTAVLAGINTLRERIHHNTDQSTSKVTVRLDRGDRTACKVTA